MSNVPRRHLHIVYRSRIRPGLDASAYARIVQTARSHNPALSLSGVLVFDGERFCQWLHGESQAVQRMLATLRADARHEGLQLLLQASLPAAQFEPGWRAGYVDATAIDQLQVDCALGLPNALAALARLVAEADLEPLVPVNPAVCD